MSKTWGPRIRLDASCFDCTFCRSESYTAQSDSGHTVYCDKADGKYIGLSWRTPKWCPLLKDAIAEFVSTAEPSA